MTNRKFNPEAVKKAHSIVVEKIEELEVIQQMVGEGDLRYAPAFGLTASGQNGVAHQNYATMHETSWKNLDASRRGLYATLSVLEDALEQNGITEYESVRELDSLNKDNPKE